MVGLKNKFHIMRLCFRVVCVFIRIVNSFETAVMALSLSIGYFGRRFAKIPPNEILNF